MSFHCLSPRVQEMMGLFAHMDARSIPRCVLERAAERSFLHIPQQAGFALHPDTIAQAGTLQSIFCPSGGWKAFEFDGMIGECLKYSLLQFSTADGEKFYSMHPLVQKYLQLTSSSVHDCPAGRLMVRLLASATTVGGWYNLIGFNRLLGPHVRLIRLEEVTEAGDHYGFGHILSELGNELSIAHMERCVEKQRTSGGRDDEAVVVAITGLATSYYLAGKAQEALLLDEEVLERRKRLHGPDHLETLSAMASLASSYHSLGREQEALLLDEEVFKQRKERLGPDHLETLMAMASLASSYRSLGRAQEALPLDEEVLKQRKRLLGLDHIQTLMAMGSLANSYQSLGRLREALPLEEEIFKHRKRLLGRDHLDTLVAMGNLAATYQSLGREKEALLLKEEVFEKRTRLLGLDHRDTLRAMRHLLVTLKALGMETDRTLAEVALPLHETVYGVDHRHTIRVRNLLM